MWGKRLLLDCLIMLSTLIWAGLASSSAHSGPARNAAGSVAAFPKAHSSPATATPTVTLTPSATVPPSIEEHITYLPLVERQVLIPGSLALEEVYITSYDGHRPTTFRPCQAVVMWIRLRNDAGIPQPAAIFWQTQGPAGQLQDNLDGHRQVSLPPGESSLRLLGAPDLDAPAGEYQFVVWFTSGTDRQELTGSLALAGEPAPPRYLEGYTGAIDPANYDVVLGRGINPPWTYVTQPVRKTDVFTMQDTFVVQSTLWEGIRRDTAILTRRYRPDGRPWGQANYGFRYFDRNPGCLRRPAVWWYIDEWMKQTPGQWSLAFSSDGGETWQGRLFFTLTD
ncbi:MAG: hypothetical protein ACE5HA_05735 [Anaerolineae bacterium]